MKMQYKVLFGAMAASLLSASSFAIDITNGTVVSHKEWTTGSVKSVASKDLKPTDVKVKLANLYKKNFNHVSMQQNNDQVFIYTRLLTSDGMFNHVVNTNEDITIDAFSEASMVNASLQDQSYNVMSAICSFDEENSFNCATVADSVILRPGGSVNFYREPSAVFNFDHAGVYTIISYTMASRAAQGNTKGIDFISDDGYNLTVTDSK